MRLLVLALLMFQISDCFAKSPGEECLDSFRMTLKDPESGKVIKFEAPTLSYTATNSYGARVQGKALCRQMSEGWERDHYAETMMGLKLTKQKFDASSQCLRQLSSRAKQDQCSLGSEVLRRAHSSGRGADPHELQVEIMKELGFN